MEEELAHTLEIVADQLGIAVEHIYDVFVSAQATIGVVSVIMLAVGGMAVVASTTWFYKTMRSAFINRDGEWEVESQSFVLMCSVVFCVVCTTICITIVPYIETALLRMLCPEYTAIRSLISLTMGGRT